MEAMEWAEIKRRLLDGTSVQILADLNGVTYKTMYNRIMAHQVKDGVTYLTPENTKGLKKAKAISKTKQAQSKAKEKAAGIPEAPPVIVTNDYSCKGCAHCMQRNGRLLCGMGHKCGENCVCSDYKPFPEPAPEKKPSAPEVVPEWYEVQPQTIDEINQMYFTCLQLADKYKKQAEDWRRIMEACASWANRKEGVELPEVDL